MGKITRQELSPGLVSELNKSGILSELETKNKNNLVEAINEVSSDLDEHKADEAQHNVISSTHRTGKDEQSTFTVVEEKRIDGTLYCKSVLSEPNEQGNYTVRTITYYNKDGTEPVNTPLVYELIYDGDGDLVDEVLQ